MANYIQVDMIEEGMIIAEPVTNSFGHTLLAPGSKLNLSHKKLLKTWNVRAVAVKGEEDDNKEEITEEQKTAALEHLKKRLRWRPRNENEKDLLIMGINNKARSLPK